MKHRTIGLLGYLIGILAAALEALAEAARLAIDQDVAAQDAMNDLLL